MPRGKRSNTELKAKELDLKDARRHFGRRSARSSKYDGIISAAEKLEAGRALLIEKVSYSEVTGIRQRIRNMLDGEYKIEATKSDREKNLFDVIVHRK